MTFDQGNITTVRNRLSTAANRDALVVSLAEKALARANRNEGRNTYLWRNPAWTLSEAQRVAAFPSSDKISSLWGIPVSVKDCFDLAGSPTSCGTKFYRDLNGIATEDSWLVERLRAVGAIITGKTHLHPLAYGITGENPDFGDCLQPGNPAALTGGSSSGAAASILEGSAMAAIGTDTGGSIRVPAALCGLAGYRASHGRGNWRGGAHLAESFDTFGWLFRHLQDGPLLGSLFGPTDPQGAKLPTRFAVVENAFLHDSEPAVVASLRQCQAELEALGLTPITVPIDWWSESMEIFAPIQAHEAARIHSGHFHHFEASIRQRLEWGASLSGQVVADLRIRHEAFRARMDDLLANCELLLLPAASATRLAAGADHSQTRARLLRYTTPISLSGMPAVTIPYFSNGIKAGGMQLVAAREDDARLLAIAALVGEQRKSLDEESPTP
jgi:Asp-tRNA(Asn)/Glu-tRNA(Gln) amidotransferase A subunit family amidase